MDISYESNARISQENILQKPLAMKKCRRPINNDETGKVYDFEIRLTLKQKLNGWQYSFSNHQPYVLLGFKYGESSEQQPLSTLLC